MAFTTVPTFSTNQLLTSTAINTYLRDNMAMLASLANTGQIAWDSTNNRFVISRAGQAAFDLFDTVTGGTPAAGARWRLFADNVGGGGGSNTFGFYDVQNARVALGIDNNGALTSSTLPLTVATFKIPPLVGRVGGNATNWNTAGASNINTPDGMMEVGSMTTTLAGGGGATVSATYHTAFSDVPVVFFSVQTTSNQFTAYISAKSASSVSVLVSNTSGISLTFTINWFAFGPR